MITSNFELVLVEVIESLFIESVENNLDKRNKAAASNEEMASNENRYPKITFRALVVTT